jgi:hypothetical protein
VKPVIFHPEARLELTKAGRDYAQISPALGQRFYVAMDKLIAEVRAQPALRRMFEPPARRHFRKPFPHAIIYLDRPDEVYVVAVMPLRKEPGYWKHRLTG